MARKVIDGTAVERVSDTEIVVTRTFAAPARAVYAAWTTPALFMRWWVPRSMPMTLLSCEMDVRTGGGYRLEFGHPQAEQPMVFHGRYLEVIPGARLVWTNEESEGGAVTTVTFDEKDGVTHLTLRESYPSKAALDAEGGATEAVPEQLGQLEALLAETAA